MPGKKYFLFTLIAVMQMVYQLPLHASFEHKEIGSLYLGRGGSGVAAMDGTFAIYQNPAAFFFSKKRQLDLFFKNYYGLSGLNQAAVGFSFNPLGIPVGLGFWQYGNKFYHESAFRLAGAWGVGGNFSLALQVDMLNLWIKNYGSATTAALGMAALYRLRENINIGLRMENLNRPLIGRTHEALPLHMASGISYSPHPDISVFADVVKEGGSAFDYRFGAEYRFGRRLGLRGGFRTLTNSYAAGVSFYTGNVHIDYAFEYHPQLNFSHSLSVGYAF